MSKVILLVLDKQGFPNNHVPVLVLCKILLLLFGPRLQSRFCSAVQSMDAVMLWQAIIRSAHLYITR